MLTSAHLSSFSNSQPTQIPLPKQPINWTQLFSMFVCNPCSTSSSPSNHRQIITAVMRTRGCNRLLLSHSGLSNSALHLIKLFDHFYLSYMSLYSGLWSFFIYCCIILSCVIITIIIWSSYSGLSHSAPHLIFDYFHFSLRNAAWIFISELF